MSFYNRIIEEVHVITGVDRTLKIRLKDVRKKIPKLERRSLNLCLTRTLML